MAYFSSQITLCALPLLFLSFPRPLPPKYISIIPSPEKKTEIRMEMGKAILLIFLPPLLP